MSHKHNNTMAENKCYNAMGKGELAQLYLPRLAPHSALNRLMQWIQMNKPLMEELEATGYRPQQKLLTPLQVATIIKFLGEP